ncbi:restriction endonuclease subunit S [Altererythrobacter litoralis]|uniref:Restriction endonuclease subunit S n=1 Tax=Altererythrobacter litoralis TaxID=3113904 RepID=A0ABU7GHM6_9SPHN|nr:restriction endonuclease subunit S [Erythrobacteraceae bacterium 1XM1-14]
MTRNLLPEGWRLAKLGDLCRIELGSTPARKSKSNWDEKRETENVWLSIADMPDTLHAAVHDSKEYVSQSAAKRMKLVPKGTLLVSFKLTLGRLCYAGRDLFTNEAIAALHDLDEGAVSKQFLYWYLTFFDWQEAAAGDEKVKGKTLNKAKLKELEVWLPPLEEQKRIVAVLDQAFAALDRAYALTEANLADAGELLEASLAKTFQREGEGWTSCTVGDLITLQRGHDITKKDQRPGDVPVVSSGGVKSYHDEAKVAGPGVVIGRKGSIGSVHYIEEPYWPHDTTLYVKDFKGNNPRLVSYLMRGLKLAELDTGAANPSLNRNLVHPMRVTWPNALDQSEIADRLKDVEGETAGSANYYLRKLDDLADLRQSILQRAFAGELT